MTLPSRARGRLTVGFPQVDDVKRPGYHLQRDVAPWSVRFRRQVRWSQLVDRRSSGMPRSAKDSGLVSDEERSAFAILNNVDASRWYVREARSGWTRPSCGRTRAFICYLGFCSCQMFVDEHIPLDIWIRRGTQLFRHTQQRNSSICEGDEGWLNTTVLWSTNPTHFDDTDGASQVSQAQILERRFIVGMLPRIQTRDHDIRRLLIDWVALMMNLREYNWPNNSLFS